MKQTSLVIIFLLSLVSSSLATETITVEKLENQISYFYQNPSKQKFEKIQKSLIKNIDKIPKHNQTIPIIWAHVVAKNYQWELNPQFFPEKISILNDKKHAFTRYIANNQQIDPRKLDIWWVSFFATGKSHYARRIFDHAILAKPSKKLDKKQLMSYMIISAAEWSFNSNCQQHKIIRDFAKKWQQESNITPTAKKLLDRCMLQK